MPHEHFLPILPFERISKKAGVERLSREGADELRDVIEDVAISIAERATRVALHAGRKTVTREDIEFVTGKVLQEVRPEAKSPRKEAARPKAEKQEIKANEKAAQAKDIIAQK